MSQEYTSKAGIDYGLGRTNIDTSNGIRYGVISFHTIQPEALQDIYDRGDNLSYESAKEELEKDTIARLESVLDDYGDSESLARSAWEAIEDEVIEAFNDHYEEDSDTYRYEDDGYILETTSLGVYVIKSPFFTYAAFCSPCCPGAGDLNTPRDGGIKTYCLGPDWFDDENPMPYTAFKVEEN